ncbi:response regulator [Actinoplanes couchii]|nr:response regulator [Actinoplanes couchii]MDR6324126.1 CheY-like chemotaxis protein [Actinoplanes couchii]
MLNVLVVDDDDADVMMIEEAMQEAAPGTVMVRASDGRAALELLEAGVGSNGRPDLILLDLNMPRMGGLETLTCLKDDERWTAIPVVVLTTSDAAPDILASYRQHASAFVTKPIDLVAFEGAIRKISDFYRDVARLP